MATISSQLRGRYFILSSLKVWRTVACNTFEASSASWSVAFHRSRMYLNTGTLDSEDP